MEDTLRYFFSALFQGFAALIALGAMFYLYFKELSINRTNQIEKELRKFLNVHNSLDTDAKIDSQGIELFVDNQLKSNNQIDRREIVVKLNANYKSIKQKINGVENILPDILRNTFIILIISIISLLLTGYYYVINYILLIIGVIIVVFSIITLIKMKEFISDIFR